MLVTVLQWLRGKLTIENITKQKWLLLSWIWSAPLGYLAVESGWIVRCVGRQPWTVYGQIRTVDAVSNLPAVDVLTSLSVFVVLYTVLFFSALYFGSRIINEGPDLTISLPGQNEQLPLEVEPAEHTPNRRPLNEV